jgi:predicted nucleic acid-binding protein
MEWLRPLRGQIVGLDTAPLIYFIEQHPEYLERVRAFFTAMDAGEFQVVTSSLTLTEVLVRPLQTGHTDLAETYRDILLNQKNLKTFSVSSDIAEVAAQLRATQNLRTPDAIQLATALVGQATFFLTNDLRLSSAANLQVLVLENL